MTVCMCGRWHGDGEVKSGDGYAGGGGCMDVCVVGSVRTCMLY